MPGRLPQDGDTLTPIDTTRVPIHILSSHVELLMKLSSQRIRVVGYMQFHHTLKLLTVPLSVESLIT